MLKAKSVWWHAGVWVAPFWIFHDTGTLRIFLQTLCNRVSRPVVSQHFKLYVELLSRLIGATYAGMYLAHGLVDFLVGIHRRSMPQNEGRYNTFKNNKLGCSSFGFDSLSRIIGKSIVLEEVKKWDSPDFYGFHGRIDSTNPFEHWLW